MTGGSSLESRPTKGRVQEFQRAATGRWRPFLVIDSPLTSPKMSLLKVLFRAFVAPVLPALLGAATLLASTAVSAQSLGLFLSPPGEQNTTRSGAIVEGFSGATGAIGATGNFAVGAWSGVTGTVNRSAANSFGGAGGTGTYLALSTGSEVSIALTGDRKYVGFWWSAGNTGNTIEFYDGSNTLLATFTTNSLTTLLSGGGNITAIDGRQYAKAAYFGNPNPPAGRNTGEPYGYVNLLLQGTTVSFKRIVIRHAGGGGFELDNLAVSDTATVPGVWVDFGPGTVTLPPGAIGAVDDTANTPRDTPVSGNVAANDTTVPGATFVVPTQPANGTVTLDISTGAYTYTPNTGFAGSDSFTYRQCKPALDQAVCVSATVKVTVAPRAVNDTGSTVTNTPLSASVATNDFILAGSTFSVTSAPANGTLALNVATGSYTYTPNAGYNGTDNFTYLVCLPAPNAALCDSAVATITIAPQVVPVAAAVSITGTPSVGQLLTGSYSYSDANADLEGISGFRWVRSATNSVAGGTNVGNATSYTTVAADGGSFLFFCVTPVAVTGLSPGLEVCGPAVQVAAAVPASPAGIPTLSQWGLILLSLLIGLSMVMLSRTRL